MHKNRSGRALSFTGIAFFVALGLGGIGARAARAEATPMTRYQGIHPLSPHQGAFCYIDVPHVHRVAPPDMRVYVARKDGTYVFVGDPVALGYDGPKVGYFGPHALPVPGLPPGETIFCYLTGPHYHAVGPGDSPLFVLKDGVDWYKGDAPPIDNVRAWINEVRPINGYVPPKVDLTAAPPGYHPYQVTNQPAAPVAPPVLAPSVAGKAGGPGKKVARPTDKPKVAAPAGGPR